MDRNLREGLRWLEQAERDSKNAEVLFNAELYDGCCFHCQQSAEKALKGFLYSKGFRALVTHSVVDLLEESSKSEESFRKFIDLGRDLDRHYIGSRYPNFYPSGAPYKYYTKEMAEKCLNCAALILTEVRKFLKE